MGKKTSSTPSQADPTSPNIEIPRMDPPPPYETISRSSTSSSVRSVDHLDPFNTGVRHNQTPSTEPPTSTVSAAASQGLSSHKNRKPCDKKDIDGGCMNYGRNTTGCMNYGDNVDGCMNYGDGSDGCMNYHSPGGCMNYKSTGGCMNYEVDEEWKDNEGCLNYRRGGGCMLWGAIRD